MVCFSFCLDYWFEAHVLTYRIGSFEWGGENFADSAQDIELNTEGDEENPILRAKLGNVEGEEVEADLNLAERIGNDNGTLIFLA